MIDEQLLHELREATELDVDALLAAPLVLYGAYRRKGAPTAPSNEAFDESLKARDPQWGLRWLEDVAAEADLNGLALERAVEMPANNLTLVLRRR